MTTEQNGIFKECHDNIAQLAQEKELLHEEARTTIRNTLRKLIDCNYFHVTDKNVFDKRQRENELALVDIRGHLIKGSMSGVGGNLNEWMENAVQIINESFRVIPDPLTVDDIANASTHTSDEDKPLSMWSILAGLARHI